VKRTLGNRLGPESICATLFALCLVLGTSGCNSNSAPAPDTTPPSAPAGLTTTVISDTQINLSWMASTDNVGVTGYKVERCQGVGCSNFAQIATPTATSFSDTGLTGSTSYSYRVRATDAAGNLSNYSSTATTSTPASTVAVTISPKRAALTTGQTQTFSATVTGSSNTSVTWAVDTIPGGNTTIGMIDANGKYTPPSTAGTHTITATSVADATKSATAPIAVTDLAGVFTYHNNLSRDGTNTREFALTTSTVSTATFGKLFSCNLDGAVYAQPLWVANFTIAGGIHNVILVVSMRDTAYLFDADANPCVTYWSKTLIPAGETFVTASDVGTADIYQDIGILGTPVIDSSSNTIYLVTKTKTTSGTPVFHQRLHALNILDGSERANSPVEINGSITVSGNCEGGSSVAFNPLTENQRPGLALVNGVVYIAWASHGDNDPYHGWVIGYRTSDLSMTGKFNSSPNIAEGLGYCRAGIWMAGGAPAADSGNNLYLITGNGTFDANSGGSNYGDSVLKLGTAGGLSVGDWFTPFNQLSLDGADLDLGSGGAVILVDLPSPPAPHAHLLIGGGKGSSFNGEIYVLDRNSLGHLTSNDTAVLQFFAVGGAIFSTEAFWQNTLYVAGVGSPLKAYTLSPSTGLFDTSTVPQTSNSFGFSGATPSISSSGSTNGIVWAIDTSSCGSNSNNCSAGGPAVLHAYDATNVTTELWNSTQGSGNAAGIAVKFTVPTIANGKVYVPTRGDDTTMNTATVRGRIDVYGLLPN
jgi:chitodextrinase